MAGAKEIGGLVWSKARKMYVSLDWTWDVFARTVVEHRRKDENEEA